MLQCAFALLFARSLLLFAALPSEKEERQSERQSERGREQEERKQEREKAEKKEEERVRATVRGHGFSLPLCWRAALLVPTASVQQSASVSVFCFFFFCFYLSFLDMCHVPSVLGQ